jgi:hypothetical protein
MSEEREPIFVFPETLGVYQAELAQLEHRINALEEADLKLHAKILRTYHDDNTSVTVEMARRRDIKEREAKAREIRNSRALKAGLAETFKEVERHRYLSEGTEICRFPYIEKERWRRVIRVIVQWHGKILLLNVDGKTISWASESLQQLRDEELETVARFQADQ